MVPSRLIIVEELPLTSNGKIDRKALLELGYQGGTEKMEHEPPTSKIESVLAGIWSETLEIELSNIGRNENFFELGGHSLRVIKAIHQIEKTLGVQVSIEIFYNSPVLFEQADHVEFLIKREAMGKKKDDMSEIRL